MVPLRRKSRDGEGPMVPVSAEAGDTEGGESSLLRRCLFFPRWPRCAGDRSTSHGLLPGLHDA